MKKKYFIYLLIIPFLLLALFFNKNKILSYDEKFGYPLKKLVTFFHNHGLLTVSNQPQWHTVIGGSKEYIKKI